LIANCTGFELLIHGEAAMAYQALATGPISFLDGNSNQQEIPLSAISFGSNGPDASSWPNYAANSALIQQLLQQLVQQGLLTPGQQAAPGAALSITATEAGTAGNVIQVTISNVSTTANTMTVAVSATEVYSGLTTATIGAALGSSAATANGLVYLQSNNNQPPANSSQNTSSGPGFTYAVPEAADSTKTAFTVAAVDSADAADAANISVTVVPDPSPATTFTLTASWTKTQANIKLATLTTAGTNPFGLLVNFTAPAGGPLPAPGTVTLQGGATASSIPAAAATATFLSS
jgi:phage tail sheath gpL-like